MADPVEYKGYVINPAPYPYSDPERYSVRAMIARHSGQDVNVRPYDSGTFCDTRAEAEERSIEFAKQVIDGQVKDVSIADL
jgi:hypothetical protein